MFAFEVNFLSIKALFFQRCSEITLMPILHIPGFGIRKLRLGALLPNNCVCSCSLLNLSESSFLLSKIGMVIPVIDLVGMYWIMQDMARPFPTPNSYINVS